MKITREYIIDKVQITRIQGCEEEEDVMTSITLVGYQYYYPGQVIQITVTE